MFWTLTFFTVCFLLTLTFSQLTKDRKKSRRLPALYMSLNGSNQPFRPSREGSAGRNEVLGIKETRAPKLPLWYHGFRGQRSDKAEHDGELSKRKSHLALAPLANDGNYSGSTPSSAESKASVGRLEPLEPLKHCYHHAKQLEEILNYTWNEYLKESANEDREETDSRSGRKLPDMATTGPKRNAIKKVNNSVEVEEHTPGEGGHMFENVETLNEALEKWKEEVCSLTAFTLYLIIV